jgi:uncharacterized protein YndB with AHSA1/START domain
MERTRGIEMASEPIVKEIYVEAAPAVVFEYLTDPSRMNRWMGIGAFLDPCPGGIYSVNVNGLDVARGQYIEVVPDTKVSFSWGWLVRGHAIPAGSTRVEFELLPEAKGTLLRLTHRELPEAVRDQQDPWWAHYLGRLKKVAEGIHAGPDELAHPSVSEHI